MKIATLTESSENENRVAITPDSAKFLIKFGTESILLTLLMSQSDLEDPEKWPQI